MARLPLLRSLRVDGFVLFPHGLELALGSDLSLIVGANGLGKSTLIQMIYRSLTGPWGVTGAEAGAPLGTSSVEARKLSIGARRVFASRIDPTVETPSVELEFELGEETVTVMRDLRDLTMIAWTIGSEHGSGPSSEEQYLNLLTARARVGSHGDWLLLIRYLTMLDDDRAVLFWDRSAQSHILRILRLPPEQAAALLAMETRASSLDSDYRNHRVQLNRLLAKLDREIATLENAESNADQLGRLRHRISELRSDREPILTSLADAETDFDQLRGDHSRCEYELATARATYQEMKVSALRNVLPTVTEVQAFLVSQLHGVDTCPACGSETAREAREHPDGCLLCGASLGLGVAEGTSDGLVSEKSAVDAYWRMASLHAQLGELGERLSRAAQSVAALRNEVRERDTAISELQRREAGLERAIAESGQSVGATQRAVEALREVHEDLENEFHETVRRLRSAASAATDTILGAAPAIEQAFHRYASEFLLDASGLTWKAEGRRVGQSSEKVSAPVFALAIVDSGEKTTTYRATADEVSESQKEFLDLAFRMALIEVAVDGGSATLMIDTPESSLDAVFAPRAAATLGSFMMHHQRRLVVASNLTDGALIPDLLSWTRKAKRSESIANLLELARPTSAVEMHRKEYDAAFAKATGVKA